MPHRSIPQSFLDDAAFPIRVKLRVPDEGFGTFLISMLRWLREELGEGNFARHGADAIEGEALAIYFCQIEDALDFLAAFPEVALADGTRSRGYKAQPMVPRGRKAGGS